MERSPQFEGAGKPLVTVTNPPPIQVFVSGIRLFGKLPISLKNINNLKVPEVTANWFALSYDGPHFFTNGYGW